MGIQEKKELRNLTEYMDSEGLPALQSACGNSSLSYTTDLDESLDADMIRVGICNAKEFVEGFQKTCEDTDYKEEIQKINTVTLKLVPEVTKKHDLNASGNVTLNSDNFTIEMDGASSLSNSSGNAIPDLIKSIY